MKAYGKRPADDNCCPGHGKFPKDTYESNQSKRAHTRDTITMHQRARAQAKHDMEMELAESFNIFMYADPEPSLCDFCKHAKKLNGGSVSIGYTSYAQRYCPFPPHGETTGGRAIHTDGYQECKYHEEL